MGAVERPQPKEGGGAAVAVAAPPRWAAAAVLAVLAMVCCSPLLAGGWFVNQEQIRPVARAFAAYQEIAAGDLYPRWIADGYLGKGMPLFNFYPPAFSFLVAYVHALGVPLLLGTKLVLFALFFVGSLGAWLWVRPHLGHDAALVAAVLYLFAPYHFVDVYVRGATAEFTALAALPFLFHGIDALADRPSARGFAILALSSASIVLSHFLGALMIAPFAAVYALVGAVRSGGAARVLARVVGGAALGAALSAFYWLPAIVENDALSAERLERSVTGYYSPFAHFVRPIQWLETSWGFGPSAPDPFPDGMSFQIGLLLVVAVVLTVALGVALSRVERGFVLLALGLGLAALGLTGSASRALYEGLRPLQLVQFPWRFLGPVTLFFAAGGAGFAAVLAGRWRRLGPGLAALVAALAIALSAPQRSVDAPMPLADEDGAIEAAIAGDPWAAKFGNEDEYLPKEASSEAALTRPGGPTPMGIGATVSGVRAGRKEVTFEVTSEVGRAIAIVPWHAFPGWEITLDGGDWPLAPGPEGLIAFWVPEGAHVARVRFGTTAPRVAGWLLAAAGGALLLGMGLRERARRRLEPGR